MHVFFISDFSNNYPDYRGTTIFLNPLAPGDVYIRPNAVIE